MSQATSKHTALIAGVTGAVGGALARELGPRRDWQVYGLSRGRPATAIGGVEYIQADLGNANACREHVAALEPVTHVFYCGRATHAEQVIEDAQTNLALLKNLIDAAESASDALRHVHLVQGGKVYGVHVGPFKTPAREDDPRAVVENFNYEQEDFLRRRSNESRWSWSASRPNTLVHYSPDIARNLVSTLGAYAAMCAELGAALDFPGHRGAYASLTQVTSIELLARAIAWMASTEACANQAFNVTNGDLFRWDSLWPRLAAAFGLTVGPVRPMKLASVMEARGEVWARACTRHGLRETRLEQVANWGYADATLERYWDEILSTNKARRFGFDGWDDSEERFFAILDEYRHAKILP